MTALCQHIVSRLFAVGVLLVVVVGWVVSSPVVLAQYTVDLQNVDLDEALKEVIATTNVGLIYDPELVRDKKITCSIQQASTDELLQCVLEGTGLSFRRFPSGTYMVEALTQESNEPDETTTGQQKARIQGRLVDVDTRAPIPGVHVFLAFTRHGSTTDNHGWYELTGIPPGAYQLTASMVGYESVVETIEVTEGAAYEYDFILNPAIISLEEVTVTGKPDRIWQRNLRQFEELFLGTSEFAEETEILNPFVLNFVHDATTRTFSATAIEPLEIENRPLGYRLSFILRRFIWDPHSELLTLVGLPHFEEMNPLDEEEARYWMANREQAYQGSKMHLFRSLGDRSLFKEGFQVNLIEQTVARPVDGEELTRVASPPYAYEMSFNGTLQVTYRIRSKRRGLFRRESETLRYWIMMDAPMGLVGEDGFVSPPSILRSAYYPKRIAELLPREYGLVEDVSLEHFLSGPVQPSDEVLEPLYGTYYIVDGRRIAPSARSDVFSVQRGMALMRDRRWERAINVLSNLLRERPDDLEIRYLLGICYRERVKAFPSLAQWENTVEQFEWILSCDSLYRDVFYQYALLWRYREQFDRAIELAELQVQLRPELDHAHHGLFGIYRIYINSRSTRRVLRFLEDKPGPYARYFHADVLRNCGRLDEAETVFHELLEEEKGLPDQPMLLSLARIYYEKGEKEKGQRLVDQAISSIQSRLDAELVFDDVKYLVTLEELSTFRELKTAVGYRRFFEVFWTRRDPLPAARVNPRLTEHYRRLLIAGDDYVWTGLRTWHTNPDKTGQLEFPPAFELNELFNDVGLVYIRHGEPEERAISDSRSWRYQNPLMDFHFVMAGGGNNWRLSAIPPITPSVISTIYHWGGLYADVAILYKEDLYDNNSTSLMSSTMKDNYPSNAREDLELIYLREEMREAGRVAVTRGLTSDRHTWDKSIEHIGIPLLLTSFRGHDDLTRLELHYDLPTGYITDNLKRGQDTIGVELGVALHDTTWIPLVKQPQVISIPYSNDPSSHLIGSLNMSVPPDSYHVFVHFRPEDTDLLGAYQFERRLSDYHRHELAISDLLPAFSITQLSETKPTGRSDYRIVGNPSRRFVVTDPVHVYYEIYNLTYGPNDRLRFSLEITLRPVSRGLLSRLRSRGENIALKILTEREETETSLAEHTEIDVSAVRPGHYTLEVTITDLNSSASVSTQTTLELTKK